MEISSAGDSTEYPESKANMSLPGGSAPGALRRAHVRDLEAERANSTLGRGLVRRWIFICPSSKTLDKHVLARAKSSS